MSRNTFYLVLDTLLALLGAAMILTGIIMRFILPPGSGMRASLWSLARHDWGTLHFWLAVAIAAIVVLHLALHWQWVCTVARRLWPQASGGCPGRANRLAAAAILFVFVAGGTVAFYFLAQSQVTFASDGFGRQAGASATVINGSMTLAEAANALNVPPSALKAHLHLPGNTADNERLGRLRQQYNFTMADVRRIAPENVGTEHE